MIHTDRSTRSMLYRLQMSTVDKLKKCYVSLLIITIAAYLLLLCYLNFTSNVGMPQHDSEADILNTGCISRKLRDYKPYITNTSVLYHHPDIVHYVVLSITPRYQLIYREYM